MAGMTGRMILWRKKLLFQNRRIAATSRFLRNTRFSEPGQPALLLMPALKIYSPSSFLILHLTMFLVYHIVWNFSFVNSTSQCRFSFLSDTTHFHCGSQYELLYGSRIVLLRCFCRPCVRSFCGWIIGAFLISVDGCFPPFLLSFLLFAFYLFPILFLTTRTPPQKYSPASPQTEQRRHFKRNET